ncbi:hypothetical protein [Hydrogenophaga sp. 2FB]|uniref:hypothetical protein n=1 Tax=Hydrogenophaga sp. 2FB TaxID=2502187 RepID=UPI0010F6A044|nr:hypothetical protein [Hydrogenophaga sp. 2FB]
MNARATPAALDHELVNLAARMASERVFSGFKIPAEGVELALRHGAKSSVRPEDLVAILSEARNCHWCNKSLGSKQNACFTHTHLLSLGHGHELANICVSCQACASHRVKCMVHDPLSFRDFRMRRTDALDPDACGLLPAMGDSLSVIHGNRVYVLCGENDSAWAFLTYGISAYEDRLRHLKLGHHDPGLLLRSSGGLAPGYKALIVRDAPSRQRFLKEASRAGEVEILSP